MKKNRFALMLGISVVVLLAFAGVAIGSNMGFKLNKALVSGNSNIVSIPYNQNYANANAMRADITNATNIYRWNGTAWQRNGGVGSINFVITPGEAYDVRVSSASNWTVVGSHNPSLGIGLVAGNSNMIGVPYHTTATNANTLRSQITNCTNIYRWNGSAWQRNGGVGSINFSITAGEGYDVRVSAGTTWTPAHY